MACQTVSSSFSHGLSRTFINKTSAPFRSINSVRTPWILTSVNGQRPALEHLWVPVLRVLISLLCKRAPLELLSPLYGPLECRVIRRQQLLAPPAHESHTAKYVGTTCWWILLMLKFNNVLLPCYHSSPLNVWELCSGHRHTLRLARFAFLSSWLAMGSARKNSAVKHNQCWE